MIELGSLATSQTSSRGRKGYSSQFRLVMPPEIIWEAYFQDYWKIVIEKKQAWKDIQNSLDRNKNFKSKFLVSLPKKLLEIDDEFWN